MIPVALIPKASGAEAGVPSYSLSGTRVGNRADMIGLFSPSLFLRCILNPHHVPRRFVARASDVPAQAIISIHYDDNTPDAVEPVQDTLE